jgi:hypothetical protein
MMRHPVPLAHLPLALATVLISLGSMLPGQTGAADRSNAAECAAIEDPTARLACYDAAFPRTPHTSPATPAKVAVATDEPASETRKFGLSAKLKRAIEPKAAQPPVTATRAAVRTVSRQPSGYLLIGLDNDQMWQQTEIDPQIWLRPGDQVTIRRASMGSYLLDTPAHYSTRVRRLQ